MPRETEKLMKLIHCADLHLDSPMRTHMSARQASARNTQILDSFLRLTDYAQSKGVRAVLIAGDLFDGTRVHRRTVDAVLSAIAQTPEVDYLYLPGNHDGAAQAFSDRVLPDNLKQFAAEWTTFRYDNVAVSGVQLCRENVQRIYDAVPNVPGCINIAVLHGQVGTVSGEDRVNLNALRGKNIDYLALGHVHSFTLQPLDERGVYCYCGCLEGRGFDECGEKGFVLLDTEGAGLRPQFVPFARCRLHRVPVDITGLVNNAQIARAMKQACEGISREDMVEFLLRGEIEPGTDLSLPYLQELVKGSFAFAKVKDETTMTLDPERYRHDVSLKGAFIRMVLAEPGTEAEKAAIIRTGLQALAGEEIGL